MSKYLHFETERLVLRPTSEDDADFMFALLNSPAWLTYIGDRKVYNTEDAARYIRERVTPQLVRLGYSNYTVIRKTDGAKMGVCGLYDRPGVEGIDIGFAFLPQFTGQGYAHESAVRVLHAAYESFGLKALRAITTEDNLSSQKLLIKLGFTFTGVTRLPDDPEELMLFQHTAPVA